MKTSLLALVVSFVALAAGSFVACAPPVEPDVPRSSEPSSSGDDGKPPGDPVVEKVTSGVAEPLASEEPREGQLGFARAVASFGSKLAPRLREGRPAGGNLVFSPLGIHVVLSALASGAGDASRAELAQLLGLPVTDTFQSEYGKHLNALRSASGAELHVRLDYAQQLTPDADWVASLTRDFQASFERQDFFNDARGSTARIDGWFREKTRGRIESVYGSDALPRTSSLVASSALTFRMNWAQRFSLLETSPRPFILDGGKTVSVPTMRAEKLPILVGRLGAGRFGSSMGVGVPGPLWVAIPFSGDASYLLLGLPGVTSELPALEQQLSEPGVGAIFKGLEAGNHEVLLPKVDWVTPTFSLTSEIQKLAGGVELGKLDLSRAGLSGPLGLNSLVQRVAVRWDEQGADLAAATSSAGVGIGLATVKPIAFDHPFVFAVVERDTELILFQGRVSDPRTF